MNFNLNDNPVLVAPRPVRITSAYPHFARSAQLKLVAASADQTERVKLHSRNENSEDYKHSAFLDSSSDKDLSSPRSSPRSTLPSEALEEFLYILRPAIFPPSSPILRPRTNGTISLPSFGLQYRPRNKIDAVSHRGVEHPAWSFGEDIFTGKSPEPIFERDELGDLENFDPDFAPRWHTAQTLTSPISRMHTRNPFQRHPSYDMAFAGVLSSSRSSPSLLSTPMSPASIPLPTPTADEFIDVY
ncbi:hypothetical protein BJ138DRAFT_1089047 [Hygrophoropsis aurantiaca]|uniref:Uncharacterized protein n=1 Tax=Hygrophoropsis aurantiaca TaxID=72124 RepID=A0ACB8A8X8_9AGAM|nr:hypothetical protein BJ138DRAFT_1089047 [Hygrophoropsis aurantiaca]